MQTEAERNIGFVIRVFQIIGWPLAIIFVPTGVFGAVIMVFIALSKPKELPMALGGIVYCLAIAAFFIWAIKVIRRMKRRDPSARAAASVLCSLMFPGFPVFTIAGVMCLFKIQAWYEPYCREPEFESITPA